MNPMQELRNVVQRRQAYFAGNDYRDFLNGPTETQVTPAVLQLLLDRFAPGVRLAAEDDPARQERERIGRDARERWKDLLVGRLCSGPLQRAGRIEGMVPCLLALVDDRSTPENEAAIETLGDGDARQMTDLVSQRLRWAEQVTRECAEMTDAQLAERMRDAFYASQIMRLSDGYRDLVRAGRLEERLLPQLPADGSMLGRSVAARLQLMGSDYYALLNPADLGRIDARGMKSELAGDKSIVPELNHDPALTELADSLGWLQEQEQANKAAFLTAWLGRQYEHPEQLRLFDPMSERELGTAAEPNLTGLVPDHPVGVTLPNGKKRLLYVQENAQGQQNAVETSAAVLADADHVRRIDDLVRSVADADPALLWGSEEYQTMKRALTELKQDFAPLEDPPITVYPRKRALENLLEAADAYLERKKIKHNDTDRERLRMQAAEKVRRFAKEQLSLCKAVEPDKWERQWDRHPLQELTEEQEKQLLERRIRCLKAAETLEPGSRAQLLCQQTAHDLGRIETLAMLRQGRDAFTPAEQRWSRRLLGQLCTVDLLLNEHHAGQGEAGPMEQALNTVANPEAFVEAMRNTPVFQEITVGMTPERFTRFLAENGERAFTAGLTQPRQARPAQPRPAERKKDAPGKAL